MFDNWNQKVAVVAGLVVIRAVAAAGLIEVAASRLIAIAAAAMAAEVGWEPTWWDLGNNPFSMNK